jgi:hypothetical protein
MFDRSIVQNESSFNPNDLIRPGDIVLTCFGWQAIVNRVYNTLTCGQIGYSVSPFYATSNGHIFTPPHASRRLIWDAEIIQVVLS